MLKLTFLSLYDTKQVGLLVIIVALKSNVFFIVSLSAKAIAASKAKSVLFRKTFIDMSLLKPKLFIANKSFSNLMYARVRNGSL